MAKDKAIQKRKAAKSQRRRANSNHRRQHLTERNITAANFRRQERESRPGGNILVLPGLK